MAYEFSIYIPRMSASVTENMVRDVFKKENISDVSRIDFTIINKKPGFSECSGYTLKSAFIHFTNLNNNAKIMKSHFQHNDEPLKILPNTTREYWLILKNNFPIEPTLMNVHQIVENSRYLEEKLMSHEKIIEEQQQKLHNLERKLDVTNNLLYKLFITGKI